MDLLPISIIAYYVQVYWQKKTPTPQISTPIYE